MPKRYDIKWRDKDIKELERVTRNYNAKINRIANKDATIAEYLPEKISIKELKSNIGTRQDFNRQLNSLKRFSRKGAEKIQTSESGLTLTNYEINEAKIKTRIVNARRTRELKDSGIDITKGNMGEIESQNLRPKKFSTNKTATEWDKFNKSLDRELASNFKNDMAEGYKQKYLKAISDFLGEDGSELYNLIKNMDAETVYKNSISDPILSIGFTSEPLPTEDIANASFDKWLELV